MKFSELQNLIVERFDAKAHVKAIKAFEKEYKIGVKKVIVVDNKTTSVNVNNKKAQIILFDEMNGAFGIDVATNIRIEQDADVNCLVYDKKGETMNYPIWPRSELFIVVVDANPSISKENINGWKLSEKYFQSIETYLTNVKLKTNGTKLNTIKTARNG